MLSAVLEKRSAGATPNARPRKGQTRGKNRADGVDTADSFGKTAIKSKGPATYEQKGHVPNWSTVGPNSASIDMSSQEDDSS